jgi:uncharacterized LabA/DUF88 family protein
MSKSKPGAIVYIDGLNFYRQKIKHHPGTKWLNPLLLAENLLPSHEILRVRYFTARVRPSVASENAPIRQAIYLRALATLGERLSVHEGTMRADTRLYPVVPGRLDEQGNPVVAKVKKVEEKGTDVALASYMIFDSVKNPADVHVLLSSDSDFAPTLRILKNELHVATGLFSPIEKPSTSLLNEDPLFVKVVRRSFLENSQFPENLTDKVGAFHRPPEWA